MIKLSYPVKYFLYSLLDFLPFSLVEEFWDLHPLVINEKQLSLIETILQKYVREDVQVTVMKEDYFCPQRKYKILFKGCMYGAPWSLLRLITDCFYLTRNNFENGYSSLINSKLREFTNKIIKYESLHQSFINYLRIKN